MDFDEKEDRIEEFNLEAFKDYAKEDEEKSINPDEEVYNELCEEDFEMWFEQNRDLLSMEFLQSLSFNQLLDKFGKEFENFAKNKWENRI